MVKYFYWESIESYIYDILTHVPDTNEDSREEMSYKSKISYEKRYEIIQ